MSQAAISAADAGLPKPKRGDASWRAGCAVTAAANMEPIATTTHLDHVHIAHVTGRVHAPGLDGVVVIDRARAADFAQLAVRRLDVAGLVDDTALQQSRAAVPLPVDAKPRECLRVHGSLQARGSPVAAAVGGNVDAPDLAASRPGQAGDLVESAIEDHLSAGRRGDDALRLLDPRVLPVLAAREHVDVMQRLLARVPRLVTDLDPAQPLDARHA